MDKTRNVQWSCHIAMESKLCYKTMLTIVNYFIGTKNEGIFVNLQGTRTKKTIHLNF